MGVGWCRFMDTVDMFIGMVGLSHLVFVSSVMFVAWIVVLKSQ